MDKQLIDEAASVGINASMYYLLPPDKREPVLRADISKEKARKEGADG